MKTIQTAEADAAYHAGSWASAALIAAAFASTGCSTTPDVGPPLRSECVDTAEVSSFTVMIREPARIQAMFAHTPRTERTSSLHAQLVGAFTGINASGQMTMVLPPLRGQHDHERMSLWGHELAHVVCGPFHDPY